jgi:hypothetical protein
MRLILIFKAVGKGEVLSMWIQITALDQVGFGR